MKLFYVISFVNYTFRCFRNFVPLYFSRAVISFSENILVLCISLVNSCQQLLHFLILFLCLFIQNVSSLSFSKEIYIYFLFIDNIDLKDKDFKVSFNEALPALNLKLCCLSHVTLKFQVSSFSYSNRLSLINML